MIIQHRRGTTSEWERADLLAEQLPEVILKDGEFAIEELTDGSRRVKIGDGRTKFKYLPYIDEQVATQLTKELLDTKTAINKKILDLDAKHNELIISANTKLTQLIDNRSNTLITAYEAGDANTLLAAKKLVDDSVAAVKADIDKNIEAADISTKNLNKRINTVETSLSTNIATTANKLTKDIASATEALATATENKLADLETKLENCIAESIDQYNSQNSATFSDILAQLVVVKENISKLKSADITLSTSISSVDNTLTVITNRLTKELTELALKHKTDYDTTLAALNKLEQERIAADTEIADTLFTYLAKIYAELADLVDDDILILEKVFSVENILTAKLNQTNAALASLTKEVGSLAPGGLTAAEERLTKKIVEVGESFNNEIKELSMAVSNDFASRDIEFEKLSSNYLRFNQADSGLYVGGSEDSVIFYCGSATDI